MGSRGSFLESGGFRAPAKWHTSDYVDGIKVLVPNDPKASLSLPERANTPGTAYASYHKDGTFSQFILFDEKRMPVYRIDYGLHRGKKSLHVHYYKDGNTLPNPLVLKKGQPLYEKHKHLFKGVK
jgi:hypothetical protein